MPLSSSCDTGGSTRCVLPISVSRPPTTHAHVLATAAAAAAAVWGQGGGGAHTRLVIAVKTATNLPARPPCDRGSNPFFVDVHQRTVSTGTAFDASAARAGGGGGGGGGGISGTATSGALCLDRQPSGAQDGATCGAMDYRLNATTTAADAPACSKCSLAIRDPYMVRIRGRVWHEQCALCTVCGIKLSDFCFVIENQLLCRQDYHRLYATKCATCKQPMLSHELCMRTRDPSGDGGEAGLVHHVSCFVCSICSLPLAAGEPYTYHPTTGALVCKADFFRGLPRPAEAGAGPASTDDRPAEGTVRKRHLMDSGPLSSSVSTNFPAGSAGDLNAKRGRTTLSYEQRCRLQQVFDSDSRPPRKVREALARDMDLPVRVIQVWFQNQRAREKKLASSAGGGAGAGEASVDAVPPTSTTSDYPSRLVIRRQANSGGWQHGSSDNAGGVDSATLPAQSPPQFPHAWRPDARSVSSPSAPGSLQADPPSNPTGAVYRGASDSHSPTFTHQQGSWLPPSSPLRPPNRQI
ncbi:hypothetical protein SprV_0702439900 [Sparganum proliferum]